MTAKWSIKSIEQIEKILNTNAAGGLSRKAARLRLKKGGQNRIYDTDSTSFMRCISRFLGDLTSYLLIIAAIVAAVFDYTLLSLVMLVTWGVNVLLALFTYIKAEKIFENSNYYSIPKAKIIREGKVYMADPLNVVRGDVILLRKGDVAPCDLRLTDSTDLIVLEYNDEKKKTVRRKNASAHIYDTECPAEAEVNMVFAGAVVINGEARAIAVDVGEDTYTVEKIGLLDIGSSSNISAVEKLGKYCTFWSVFMLVLALPITLLGSKDGIFYSFMLGIALASSTMSEMLVAIGRIITACSVINAATIGDRAGNTAIIKNVSKIESISDLDALVIFDEAAFCAGETIIDSVLADDDKELLIAAMISSNMGFFHTSLANSVNYRTSDDIALEEYAQQSGVTRYETSHDREFVEYSRATRFNFDTVLVKESNEFYAYIRGEAQAVLPRCSYCRSNGEDVPMTAELYARCVSFVNEMNAQKKRVLAIAVKKNPYNNLRRVAAIQTELSYIGLISFGDPVLFDAGRYIDRLNAEGVETVFAFETKNPELCELLSSYNGSVYYTDDIAEKKSIISKLQQEGKSIGIVASDAADMSLAGEEAVRFALSAEEYKRNTKEAVPCLTSAEREYGTQAAKMESDVLIKRATGQKYGISSLVSAIDYSRMAITNIENVVKYLLFNTFVRLGLALAGVFLDVSFINPQQILFCGLIVDFFAILVFSFEKPIDISRVDELSKNKIKKYISYSLSGLIAAIFVTVVPNVLGVIFIPMDSSDILTYGFVSVIFVQLVALIETTDDVPLFDRKPRFNAINSFFAVFALGFISAIVWFEKMALCFGISGVSIVLLLYALIPAFCVFAIFEIRKVIAKKRRV